MLSSRRVEAVSATLDDARRPDCRGPTFHDPGGWGVLRLSGGLMVTFNAADYSTAPATIALHGTLGRAVVEGEGVRLSWTDDRTLERLPPQGGCTSMDQAMNDIVDWLDGTAEFPDPPENSMHTLEAIIACHASHRRQAAWTGLPLTGADRDIELYSG